MQSLQVSDKPRQQRVPISSSRDFVGPRVRDPVPIVFAGPCCRFRAKQHNGQAQPNESSSSHVIDLLRRAYRLATGSRALFTRYKLLDTDGRIESEERSLSVERSIYSRYECLARAGLG
jgi:hypothetical protein